MALLCLIASSLFSSSAHADDLTPFALPNVYRDIQIDSAPSGLVLSISQDGKPLPCLPKSQTPCKIRVISVKEQVQLSIVIFHQGQKLTFQRSLRDRKQNLEEWLFPIPSLAITTPTTINNPATLPTKENDPSKNLIKEKTEPVTRKVSALALREPPPSTAKRTTPYWVWIVVGGVVVVTGAGIGIGIGLSQRDRVGWRCLSCLSQ